MPTITDIFLLITSVQGATDGKIKNTDAIDLKPNLDEPKKRQGRGRGRSVAGRGRGSKTFDQIRSSISFSTTSVSNGHHESLSHKVCIANSHI